MSAITGNATKKAVRLALVSSATELNGNRLTGAHKYWRIYVHENEGGDFYTVINQIKLYTIDDPSELATYYNETETAGGRENDAYSASSASNGIESGSREAFTNLDDPPTSSTRWRSAYRGAGGSDLEDGETDEWVSVNFNVPADIARYEIVNGSFEQDNTGPARISLQYSDDNIAWFTRHEAEMSWPEDKYNSTKDVEEYTRAFSVYPFAYGAFALNSFTIYGEITKEAEGSANVSFPSLQIDGVLENGTISMPAFDIDGDVLVGGLYDNFLIRALPSFDIDLTGSIEAPGRISGSIPSFDIESSGHNASGEAFGSNLPELSIEAEGLIGNYGYGILGFRPFLIEGFAHDDSVGVGTQTPALEISSTGSVGNVAGIDVDLPIFTIQSSPGANFEFSLSIESEGRIGSSAEASVELPAFAISARDNSTLNISSFLIDSSGRVGRLLYSDIALPGFNISAEAERTATIPSLEIASSGLRGGVMSGAIVLPSFDVEAYEDSSLNLPAFEISGELAQGRVGRATLNVAAFRASLSGSLTGVDSNRIDTALPAMSIDSYAVVGNVYSGLSALSKLALKAEGYQGRVGVSELLMPTLTTEGYIYTDLTGSISIELPSLRITATGRQDLDDGLDPGNAVAGAAVAMNLMNRAVTQFDSYGFNSFAEFAGKRLAASEDGIFILEGDVDNGDEIDAVLEMGKLDFGSRQLKAVDYAYIGYDSDGDLALTASADDGTTYSYAISPVLGASRHTSRTKLGKGVKARYWKLSIENVAGSDFNVDTFEPEYRDLSRRRR